MTRTALADRMTQGEKTMVKWIAMAAVCLAAVTFSTTAMADRHPPSRTPRPVTGLVNINTATSHQLELLPGVGRRTASLIVAYREKQPFKAPAEIVKVKGVGQGIFRHIKPYLTVSGPTTLALASPKASAEAPISPARDDRHEQARQDPAQ